MSKRLKLTAKECIGCKSCELACSLANEGEMNISRARIKTLTFIEGRYPLPYNFVSTCRQCGDAPCLHSCPVAAISFNRQKVVIVDQERCIGCGKCVNTCPFGAMFFNSESRKAYKCDLCKGGEPACAEICPTGAIIYKEQRIFYAKSADLEMQGCLMMSEMNKTAHANRKRAGSDKPVK